ncbi:hypothetical protein OH492_19960 [Vibrio chagasii]|nr:hypothetical protein [Vibrio chagasii]
MKAESNRPYHSFDDGDLLTMVGLYKVTLSFNVPERINVRMDFTYNNEK